MKLSLRAARKLEAKISYKVAQRLPHTIAISAFDSTPVADQLQEAQEKLQQEVDLGINLIEIRYFIRRDIQRLNEESGINALITERKKYLDILTLWSDVRDYGNRTNKYPSTEIIEGRLEAIRKTSVKDGLAASLSSSDTVTVSAIDDVLLQEVDSVIRNIERQIEKFDDQILELNMGTKVILSDDATRILQSANLL